MDTDTLYALLDEVERKEKGERLPLEGANALAFNFVVAFLNADNPIPGLSVLERLEEATDVLSDYLRAPNRKV